MSENTCPHCAWNSPGHITLTETPYNTTISVVGNFHSDIFPTKRDSLKKELESALGKSNIVINLSSLTRIDSWGVDMIINLIDDIVADNRYVHIVYGKYNSYLSGLKRDLARHGTSVGFQEEFNPFKPKELNND